MGEAGGLVYSPQGSGTWTNILWLLTWDLVKFVIWAGAAASSLVKTLKQE